MKLAVIYFFGAVGIVSAVKVYTLFPVNPDHISVTEDRFKNEEKWFVIEDEEQNLVVENKKQNSIVKKVKVQNPVVKKDEVQNLVFKDKEQNLVAKTEIQKPAQNLVFNNEEQILEIVNKEDINEEKVQKLAFLGRDTEVKKNTINVVSNGKTEQVDDIKTDGGIYIESKEDYEYYSKGFKRNYNKEGQSLGIMDSIYSIQSQVNNFGKFYGSIGLSYTYDKYNENDRVRTNFMQEYKLGVLGAIYSKRLFNYSLSTTLRFEDINTEESSANTVNKLESYDYNAKLNFLSHTKIPFTLYAIKTKSPNSIRYNGTTNNSEYDNLSFGLVGQILLNIFKINYTITDSDGVYESIFSTDNRKNRKYKVTLTKDDDIHNLRLSYTNTDQEITKDSTSYTSKSSNKEEDVNLIYRAKVSDSVRFNSQSSYRKRIYTNDLWTANETKTVLSNLNLIWNPRGKHNASLSLSGTKIIDENLNNINLSQSYGYRVTKNLNLSQSSSYSVVSSDLDTIKNLNLNSNISYLKKINADISMNMSFNASLNNNSNDRDSNTSTAEITTYMYRAKIGMNQNIKSLNSRLSASLYYNDSINTLEESKKTSNANLNISTMIYSKLRNQLNIDYYNSISKILDSNKVFTSIEFARVSVKNNLDYSTRVGISGSLSSKLGFRYAISKTNGKEKETMSPSANVVFRYNLSRNIKYTSKLSISKEFYYDTMNYNFGTDLLFYSSKLTTSIGYTYDRIETDKDIAIHVLNREVHRLNVKFLRKF